MGFMIHFAHQYPFAMMGLTLGAYWIFNAFVGGMPPPEANSGIAYRWAYKSFGLLAANVVSYAEKKGFPAPVDAVQQSNAPKP